MYDVFISFSTRDLAVAEKTVGVLTEKYGLSCWIYTEKNDGGDRYKEKITDAVRASRTFVLIQSFNSVNSPEVAKEEDLADRFGIPVIPFVTDDSELGKSLAYDLTSAVTVDARNIPFEQALDKLYAAVMKKLRPSDAAEAENAPRAPASRLQRTAAPVIRSSVLPRMLGFIGRERELTQIRADLCREPRLFLYGFGGIGKSEIAAEYAYRYRQDYDTVIFAKYETGIMEMLIDDRRFALTDVSRAPGMSDREYMLKKLRVLSDGTDERTLIIVDNFDVLTDPDLPLLRDGGRYHLLITTRYSHDDSLLIPSEYIGPMPPEDQYELFIRNYQRKTDAAGGNVIRRILGQVHGHTLAIELIAKAMRIQRISPAVMLKTLSEQGGLRAIGGRVVHETQDSVYGFIQRLFNVAALTGEEKQIMTDLSMMPPEGVDIDDYIVYGQADAGVISALTERGWIEAYDTDDADGGQMIALHPLVNEVVTNECRPDLHSCRVLFDNILHTVGDFRYRDMEIDDVRRISELLEAIWLKCPEIDPEFNGAYHTMLFVFHHVEKEMRSRELALACLKDAEERDGGTSVRCAEWNYWMSDLSYTAGDAEAGLAYKEKAMRIISRAAPGSLDCAYITASYAAALIWNVKAERSVIEDTLEKSIRIAEACPEGSGVLFPNKTLMKGSACYSLAEYEYSVSDPEKAKKYLAMSSAMFERERDACGGTHVYAWLAYTDMLYAKLYAGAGEREQAVSYGRSSVDFSEKYYGREHYITLERLWSLAGVYRALGLRGEEKSLLLRLCGSYEKKKETQSAKYAAVRARLDEMNTAEAENGAAEQ